MPGDARAHLAPHDRHPQLITDHGPHRGPGRASGRGWGSGPRWDSGGSGPGGGSGRGGRGWSNGPGEGFWPGTGNRWLGAVRADRHGVARADRHGVARVGRHGTDIAGRLGVAAASWHGIAGRHRVARATGARASRPGNAWAGGLGIFAVPELAEPVVGLKHAGVLWLDLDLHVEPPVEPGVSRAAELVTCPEDGRAGPAAARRAVGLRWQAWPAVVLPGRCPCAHPVESALVHGVWVQPFYRPGPK